MKDFTVGHNLFWNLDTEFIDIDSNLCFICGFLNLPSTVDANSSLFPVLFFNEGNISFSNVSFKYAFIVSFSTTSSTWLNPFNILCGVINVWDPFKILTFNNWVSCKDSNHCTLSPVAFSGNILSSSSLPSIAHKKYGSHIDIAPSLYPNLSK